MPSPEAILNSASAIANEWQWLAVGWHAAAAAIAIAVMLGAPLSQRTAALLLTVPLISVSVLSWWAGNPFNAVVFLVLALVTAGIGATLGTARAAVDWSLRNRVIGAGLVAFGLVYPHFLMTDSWLSYLYAAPFGLIPCPTLLVVTGCALILALESRAWNIALAVAALAYGIIGVAVLGVWIDTILIGGGVLLLAAVRTRSSSRRRGATPARSTRDMSPA